MEEICNVEYIKNGLAYVRLNKNEKCGGCKACSFGQGNSVVVPAIMEKECNAGDTVKVNMPQDAPKAASLVIYVIPLLFLLVGIFAASPLGDVAQLLIGIAMLAVSFVIVWLIDRRYRKNKKFMPVVTENITRKI